MFTTDNYPKLFIASRILHSFCTGQKYHPLIVKISKKKPVFYHAPDSLSMPQTLCPNFVMDLNLALKVPHVTVMETNDNEKQENRTFPASFLHNESINLFYHRQTSVIFIISTINKCIETTKSVTLPRFS
jgi:hypothetical protein